MSKILINLTMHLQLKLCAILLSVLNGIQGAPKSINSKSCAISLPENVTAKKEPVYLKSSKDGSLSTPLQPSGSFVSLKIGESLGIFCPGDGKDVETITCNTNFDLASYSCNKSTTTDTIETEEDCGGSGKVYKVGFPLPAGDFHSIYQTCFDKKNLTPLYSFHVLNGQDHLKHTRGSFRTNGIYGKVNIDKLYKTQIEKFNKLFGPKQTFFRRPLNFLSRGHLSPEVDFTFRREQHATEMYINTAPQYQSINQGNWLRVENHVRDLAKVLQKDITVVTGILGILRLKSKKTEKEIYLGDDVIAVPAMFWKAVFDPQKQEAIVFVSSNNPHVKTFNPNCKDVCAQAGFGNDNLEYFSNYSIGLTICCKLEEFVKRNKIILPKEVNNKNYTKLLKFPKTRNKEGDKKVVHSTKMDSSCGGQFDATIGGNVSIPETEYTFQYAEGRLPELASLIGTLMKGLPHKEGQFVCILTHGWDLHIPTPVVIEMCHLVRPLLNFISRKARFIEDYVVACWRNGPFTRCLGHKEEVIAFRKGDDVIHHSSRRWILNGSRIPSIANILPEDTRIDSLRDNDKC
uniref:Endonuclease n=1 Tax=Lutzomyia longipalpis TaxID=7200 RepID=A0A1B0CL74_LUTLO